jgi:hypothetical protein
LFINIILAFSDNYSDRFNGADTEIFGNKIIILKKVKSLRQLRRTEKELVRLNYKEAVIEGFTLKGIQQYIASKTKIWIEWSCLEYLKKAEEQENKEWYYHMAKDHFAYVGAYRECIDEIKQLKKEMWNIVMDSKTEHYTRIQALKELHSLSKTCTLLIKDLPFITNISKFYDKDILNSNYTDSSFPKRTYSNNLNQTIDKEIINEKNFNKSESSDNLFDYNGIKDVKSITEDNGFKDDNITQRKFENLDDEVMEDMQRQVQITDSLKDKSIEEMTEEDWNKIITPQHKESVRKIRELLDD